MKKFTSSILLFLMLSHCSKKVEEETSPSNGHDKKETGDSIKETTPQQQAIPDYVSKELKKAQSISGVYTGTADINYTLLGLTQEDDKLTVSINHSGNDAEKQLIVHIENEEGEALCTLYSNLTIDSKNRFQGKITHSGQVGDAKAVHSVTLLKENKDTGEESADDLPMAGAEPKPLSPAISVEIAARPEAFAFEAEKINELTKTNKPVLSFDKLHTACSPKEEENEQN